ncbi:hypothetical protein F4212_01020 [Candidatus Poribacteria bacterium]|nr:hypothetical protein [Candidatus Poribacteria bacterium]
MASLRGANVEKFKDFAILRTYTDMTLQKIADMMDIATSTLGRWEKNEDYKPEFDKFVAKYEKETDEKKRQQDILAIKIKYGITLLFSGDATLKDMKDLCIALEHRRLPEVPEDAIYRIIENTAHTVNLGMIELFNQLSDRTQQVIEKNAK